jgi:uncharacterized protein (TIGR03067 family)
MRQLLGVSLFLSLAVPLTADEKEDAVKAEIKKLEGTWTRVSSILDGKKTPDDKLKPLAFTVKADGTWVMKNDTETWDGTYTLDPSKKPKAGDFVVLNGKYKGSTTLDIYEIDGDTMKNCYVVVPTGKESTKERPTDFSSKEGSGHYLYVFKREKAK